MSDCQWRGITAAMSNAPKPSGRVAIIGAGSIGAAWAIVFAAAGFRVNLQDTDGQRLDASRAAIGARLTELAAYGLVDEPADAILARIQSLPDLDAALAGAAYVQECIPEDLDLKRGLFAELDRLAAPDAILASSSSFLPASAFAGELAGRARCLVVHPGNPPYLLRVAELVPAPFTEAAVVERTAAILERAGMMPVRLGREIDGFVFNRLQGALLREAYCLVRDGVASVAEIDRIVRGGLGLGWSVIGPFETVDLNTRGGIVEHARRMGPAYRRMGRERGQDDPWTDDLVARVAAERRALLPLEAWEDRVAWRDRALMALLRCRRDEPALEELGP
jgi:L-gulonate 3-dehydrogenase